MHDSSRLAGRRANNDLPVYRRPTLLLAVAAGMCWACALAMVLGGFSPQHGVLAPVRLIFYALVLGAGLLTFVPLQRSLSLPRLAFEGVAGSFLLLYTLAFVPPPTASLLSLPEIPVYVVLVAGLFWSVSAVALPLVHGLGRRLYRQRARQYDMRRTRRQAHEAGALVALVVVLAGLRVMTPLAVLLLILIVVVAELLFLAFVQTEATER